MLEKSKMDLNINYTVIEKLIDQNTKLHLNTCLVLELKEEIQIIITESLLYGKKICLLESFWLACRSLGIDI